MAITYASDILVPPKYLDEAFLQDVVENALLSPKVNMEKIHIEMGSALGENYCSKIYRVKILYSYPIEGRNQTEIGVNVKPKVLSVIIKSMAVTVVSDMMKDMHIFHKEKLFYSIILPRLETLYLKEDLKFAPSLYLVVKEPINTLVLEDLGQLQYTLASREKGLDELHARLVMKKLAKFHAASMVLLHHMSHYKKLFNVGMLSALLHEGKNDPTLRYYKNNILELIQLLEKFSGYEDIAKKVIKYEKNLKQNLLETVCDLPDDLKVLNHGDLWVNNILFRYNANGQPIDLCFIDFQLCYWSSPGIDLNYFFYTSLALDVLKTKTDDLIMVYHQTLTTALHAMNYEKIPTYQQLYREVRKRLKYGFFATFGILPLIAMEKKYSRTSCGENRINENIVKEKMKNGFTSKRIEDTLRYSLKLFDQEGILD